MRVGREMGICINGLDAVPSVANFPARNSQKSRKMLYFFLGKNAGYIMNNLIKLYFYYIACHRRGWAFSSSTLPD